MMNKFDVRMWKEANPIRLERLKKEWTRGDLSLLSGISSRAIYFLETGRTQWPREVTMDALAEALELDTEALTQAQRSWFDERPVKGEENG